MGYDTKCWELADLFLSDEPALHTTDRVEKLAQEIQDAIESFIRDEKRNYEPPDPPGWEGGFAANH